MTSPTPTPREVGGLVRRIQQFSTATERLFARLYSTLSLRQDEERQDEQARRLETRNRRLRRMLRTYSMRLDRLEAILASIPEGVILQDRNGAVLEMNAAARSLVGTDRNLWDSALVQLAASYADVQTVNGELAPLGQPQRLTIQGSTVSAQVMALADAGGRRFGTLILLKSDPAQQSLDTLRASLVNQISHELRTPLAPLRMASDMLMAAPQDQPANRRMLELISRNVDILDRMVNEMIDIAAMSSGMLNMNRQSVLLEDLVMELYDEYKEDIAEMKHELYILIRDADRLIVEADRRYLRWAISNVLKNSIQYSEPQGRIYLRMGVTDGQTERIFIEIEDRGVGISEADQTRLFELFFRGTPRNRAGKRLDPRGLGQGLYVARTIAEAHGGRIQVQSREGEGSRFVFLLPAQASSALMAD